MRAKRWMIACATAGIALGAQAELTHRYAFDGNADDDVGTLNGTMSAAGATLEAPGFTNDIPGGANTSFASQSIEVGMTAATASWVNYGSGVETDIYDGKAGSVAYWFKAAALLNGRDMLSNIGGANTLRTMMRNNGQLRLAGAGVGNMDFTFSSPVTVDTWHHLVVSWDDTTGSGTIALDGDIQSYSFATNALEDPARLMLGNFTTSGATAQQFEGQFYDLQIYDTVLASNEVAELYTNPGTAIIPVPPELTHRYAFASNAVDAVGTLDGSLTVDNGTTIEAPEFSMDVPSNAVTSFASHSIEFGMSIGTKASSVNFGSGVQTDIYDGKAGSVAYWFKADQLLNGRDLLSNIGGANGLRTMMRDNGQLRLAGAGMGNVDFTFSSPVTADTWHHLVVNWDDAAGTGSIALDGDVQSYAFTPGTLVDPSRLILGNFADNDSQLATQFDGRFYDLQIYDDVLSAVHIAQLSVNPGSRLYAETPAFPELEEMTGPELIFNSDFSQVSDTNGIPHVSQNYNITNSFGDYAPFNGATARATGWEYYYDDPNGLTARLGNVRHLDEGGIDILDGTFYIDAFVNPATELIDLNSVMDFRHGVQQVDILNGVTIDAAGTYRFTVDAFSSRPDLDPASGTLQASLTDGSGTPIAGLQGQVDTWDGVQTIEISGDLLDDGQVNVMADMVGTNAIPGYPTASTSNNVGSIVAKVQIRGLSLAQLLVPETGDYNRDGVVDQDDVDLANSYLDGSIDGGPTAAERQQTKTLEELNLTEFDLNTDGVFDEDDITVLEGLAVPVILGVSLNGSGHFEVQVGSLSVGTEYFLVQSTDLVSDPTFDDVVDSVVAGSDTETLTDTNMTADAAFYKVTK